MAYRSKTKWRGNGKMSDSRIAWVNCVLGVFEVRQHLPNATVDEEDEQSRIDQDNQIGPNIRLSIHQPGKRVPLSLALSSATVEELRAVRDLLDFALDLAEPVVKERDKVARNAKEAGDDSYVRSYRRLPEFVIREKQVFTYSEGVLFGPDGLPVGGGQDAESGGEHRGGSGGAGDGMADEEPGTPGPEDDGEETD